MREFRYNTSTHTEPVGTVDEKSYITYAFEVAQNVCTSKVFFVFNPDGSYEQTRYEMKFVGFFGGYKRYEVSVKFPSEGLYWYHFEVDGGRQWLVQRKGDTENRCRL